MEKWELDQIRDSAIVMAQVAWTFFSAARESGFTEEHALRLTEAWLASVLASQKGGGE